SSFRWSASTCAFSVTRLKRGDIPGCDPPYACGSFFTSSRPARPTAAGSTFILRSSSGTMPSRCSTSATSRCSGSSCGLFCCCAISTALATASRAFSVYLLMFIISSQLRVASCQRLVVSDRLLLQFLQLLEILSLFGRQVARQLHVGGRVEIAVLVRLA